MIQSQAEVLDAVDGIVGVRLDGRIPVGVVELARRRHRGQGIQHEAVEATGPGTDVCFGQYVSAQPPATLPGMYEQAPDFAGCRVDRAYAHAAGGFAVASREQQEPRCGVESAELAQLRGHVIESSAHIGCRSVSFHRTLIVSEEAPDYDKIGFVAHGIHVNIHHLQV